MTDILREQRVGVLAVNFGEKAEADERFFNRAAEMYWRLQERSPSVQARGTPGSGGVGRPS